MNKTKVVRKAWLVDDDDDCEDDDDDDNNDDGGDNDLMTSSINTSWQQIHVWQSWQQFQNKMNMGKFTTQHN